MHIDTGTLSSPCVGRRLPSALALFALLVLVSDWAHAVTGRVTSLRVQGLANPLLYFTLDDPAACNGSSEAYFFAGSDADFDYALKSLLAARLGGREIKLQGVAGCPSAATLVDASAVRIVDSSPAAGPPTDPQTGLAGRVTNLKIQQGTVFFRIDACSGGDPYFRFAKSALPGGLSLLLAAQASKRNVRVFTTTSGSGSCPSEASGHVDLAAGGGLWLL